MGVHFSPLALRQCPSRALNHHKALAGWPGFLCVELVPVNLVSTAAQNVKISVSP